MAIKSLSLSSFRCFKEIDFSFSSGTNVLTGVNGSGKSSVLEAIHLLSTGKSFRTAQPTKIIKHNQSSLTVFAQTNKDSSNKIGLELNNKGKKQLKINHQNSGQKQIALNLPVITIDPMSYLFLDNGPQYRRKFFDWMMFHVKHDYLSQWKNINQLQKHINQLLKEKQIDQLFLWLDQYQKSASFLTNQRQTCFLKFLDAFNLILNQLSPGLNVRAVFYRGWNDDLSLKQILKKDIDQSLKYGQLLHGPHKMDIYFYIEGKSCKDVLSRGQKKIVSLFCYLSCLELMNKTSQYLALFLLDDLDAELDDKNKNIFLKYIENIPNQTFITSLKPDLYRHMRKVKVFHVKH